MDQHHEYHQPDNTAHPVPIALEPMTALFVAGGVPLVFHLEARGNAVQAEDWLYIPDRVIDQILTSLNGDKLLGPTVGAPVATDECARLYPLVIGGAVRGILFDQTENVTTPLLDPRPVLDWLVRRELEHHCMTGHHEPDMTTTLITCDSSAERLLRSALNLLVSQVPSGLAATYGEVDGIYRLQTAVGNIAMWDLLEGDLTHSSASRWADAINRGHHFLPSGFLPERPLLLDLPPDFLFVHHGLKSNRTRSFIVMPVPGNITRLAGERTLAVARFVGSLDGDKFGMGENILDICTAFNNACRDRIPFDRLVLRIFEILSERVGLSRLAISDKDGSGWTVRKRSHADPVIRRESSPATGSAMRLGPGTQRLLVLDVFSSGLLTEGEAKRYYLDNVKAELVFRTDTSDRSGVCIAFGQPESGCYLKRSERILETAATVLQLYQFVSRLDARSDTAADWTNAGNLPNHSQQRLETAATLAEGHFHSVFDIIAWLLGQTEVQSISMKHPGAAEAKAPAPSSANLTTALERVVRHLEQVRRILHEAPTAQSSSIPAARLIAELPAMLEGYVHFVQDTKNIAITLIGERQAIRPFQLPTADVYDILCPTLLAFINEAICSGEIRISALQRDSADAICISCPRPLIEHTSLREILQRWSGQTAERDPDTACSTVRCGHYYWLCDPDASDPQRAWLMKDTTTTDETDPIHRASSPNTEVR